MIINPYVFGVGSPPSPLGSYNDMVESLAPFVWWRASDLEEDNVTIPDAAGDNDMVISGTLDSNYSVEEDSDLGQVIRFNGAHALSDNVVPWSSGHSLIILLKYGGGYSSSNNVVGQGNPSSSFRYDTPGSKHRALLFNTENITVVSEDDIVAEQWIQVTIAYDGSEFELYIDGASEGTNTVPGNSASFMRMMRNTFNSNVNPGPVNFHSVACVDYRITEGEAEDLFSALQNEIAA